MSDLNDNLGTDIAFSKGDFVVVGGDLALVSGVANVIGALFRCLITRPGTVIHRPAYGVGIQDFQGALASLANQQALAGRITTQFGNDPRVDLVNSISIQSDDSSPELTRITVAVNIKGQGTVNLAFTPFADVPGVATA